MRWCIPAAADAAAVSACTQAVGLANTAGVTFTCVAGQSEEGCLDAISKGTADLITLGGASELQSVKERGSEARCHGAGGPLRRTGAHE